MWARWLFTAIDRQLTSGAEIRDPLVPQVAGYVDKSLARELVQCGVPSDVANKGAASLAAALAPQGAVLARMARDLAPAPSAFPSAPPSAASDVPAGGGTGERGNVEIVCGFDSPPWWDRSVS